MATVEDKMIPPQVAQRMREELHVEGKRVVQCHGCFDIVHPGHLRYLRFAKSQGDVLIVSITSDRHVGKGAERPFVGERLRAESLAALEAVDYVVIDDHEWAGPILDLLKPDVYVKGREYEFKQDVRFAKERALVESYGGRVIFSSGEVVYSSSEIIDRWSNRMQGVGDRLSSYCTRHGLDHFSLAETIRAFRDRKILVIGDAIYDHYVLCDLLGAAEESPMLSLAVAQERWYTGGAALIASQIAHLGARPGLLTSYDESALSERWRTDLLHQQIAVHNVREQGRPLFVKQRFVVDDRKLLKVNQGRKSPLSTQATTTMIARFDELVGDYEAVIVVDFGYGLLGASMVHAIGERCRQRKVPLFIDVSSSAGTLLDFRAVTCASPNEKELRAAMADHDNGLSVLAARYFQRTLAKRLIITLGARGVVHFERPSPGQERLASEYLPSFAHYAADTIGAGDVMLAALTLCEVVGAPPSHGLYLGSCLSALQVAAAGNDARTLLELERCLATRPELGLGWQESGDFAAAQGIKRSA